MGLPPGRRLRKPSEFQSVIKTGKKAGDRFLLMSAARSAGDGPRYGLAVSKRVGNAVARNRLKRRLRELLRDVEAGGKGWDVVVSARQAASEASFDDLRRSVRTLVGRLGVGTLATAGAGNSDNRAKG